MQHNAILVTRGAKASGVVKSTICFSKKTVGNTQRSEEKKYTHTKITKVEDYRISPAKLKTGTTTDGGCIKGIANGW